MKRVLSLVLSLMMILSTLAAVPFTAKAANCVVYVYAQNGIYKAIKVTVK